MIAFAWCYLLVWDYSEDYGNYTTLNGWPVGLGEELKDASAKDRLIINYRLTRRGRLKRESSPFYKVEILDANDKPCINIFYETPIVGLLEKELDDEKAAAFAELQQKTAYWIYTPGDVDHKEVARCTAYGLDKKELYSIQYYKDKTFASADESKYVQWAVFNDVNGKQMMVTDNGADRMRQTVKNGLVTGCLFFTELGTPQRNAYEAYGYQYEVDSLTRQIQKQYCVDKFGAKIDSTVIDFLTYEYGRIKKTSLYEVLYPQQDKIVYDFGSFKDTLQFNKNGTLGYGTFHTFGGKYSKIVFKYDEENRSLINQKYMNDILVSSKSYSYQSEKVFSINIFEKGLSYTEKYSYPDNSTTVVSFWENESPLERKCTNEFLVDTLCFHKSRTTFKKDSLYTVKTVEYLDSLGHPISPLNNDYAKYSKYSKHIDLKTNNVRLEYFYDANGDICKSEWFDYDEYGNRTARAVAGIDGTPVRCDKWDWNENCYYKMTFLKNFNDNTYIALKGLNEFEEESFVVENTSGKRYYFELYELPSIIFKTPDDDDEPVIDYCQPLSRRNKTMVSQANEVPFLHLLSKNGMMYNASYIFKDVHKVQKRLLDGDVLIKVGKWKVLEPSSLLKKEWDELASHGGKIGVLRAINNSYIELQFSIQSGNLGAEYHFMPLTEKEIKRIK